MDVEKVERKELDQFSANILINLALINVAALAAVISSETSEFSVTPYVFGLISALLSQLLWYVLWAFEFVFGDPINEKNKRMEPFVDIAVLVLGAASASCIIYGGFSLLGVPNFLSYLLSILLCFSPMVFLIIAGYRETKTRNIQTL